MGKTLEFLAHGAVGFAGKNDWFRGKLKEILIKKLNQNYEQVSEDIMSKYLKIMRY